VKLGDHVGVFWVYLVYSLSWDFWEKEVYVLTGLRGGPGKRKLNMGNIQLPTRLPGRGFWADITAVQSRNEGEGIGRGLQGGPFRNFWGGEGMAEKAVGRGGDRMKKKRDVFTRSWRE